MLTQEELLPDCSAVPGRGGKCLLCDLGQDNFWNAELVCPFIARLSWGVCSPVHISCRRQQSCFLVINTCRQQAFVDVGSGEFHIDSAQCKRNLGHRKCQSLSVGKSHFAFYFQAGM